IMLSDLKHQIVNVHLSNPVSLSIPVRVGCSSMVGETELKNVYKRGRSWKIADSFGNEYTLASLPTNIQSQIAQSLLSMKDNRYPFTQQEVYDID
ncbi:MAG: hypothetical protein LIP01_08930, partial [Tannerellaceae bacterium]|nr:hypothetical protein [Tannerellaceae bacterium]